MLLPYRNYKPSQFKKRYKISHNKPVDTIFIEINDLATVAESDQALMM